MKNLNIEIKQKILDFLGTTKIGASSSEIAKNIGHNRITVTKYLEIMKAHKLIDYEDVAQAKLWSIKKGDKPVVLIVDDEPHIVDLISLSLIPEKFDIKKAYSGLDALDSVYRDTPDIIILDLMMPGINGYEICQKIKQNAITQHIPIIILSAKGEIEDKLKGLQIGADDYMTKPFDPMELEARVERVIRRNVQDVDTHPLTRLPGKNSAKMKLQQYMDNKQEFISANYTIKNFREFSKKYGTKKGDHVLLMLSRVFADIIQDDAFASHTIKDSFFVMSQQETLDKIAASIKKLLPYIGNDELKIDGKKLLSRDIYSKNLNSNDVFTRLGVN